MASYFIWLWVKNLCKIDETLDIKNCSCGKRLVGKLVLEGEDEILNTTEDALNNACYY